jgi:uncharacterized protein YjdB
MSTFQVVWNATTRVAKIQKDGTAPGAGFTDIGSFEHELGDETQGFGLNESHTYYHHARELLAALDDFEGQNMQTIEIQITRVVGLSIVIDDNTLAVAGIGTITPTFDPVAPTIQDISYSSSDVTKATVSAAGVVTGVAAGEAVITATSVDGGFTDTVTVTVA